jgi:hypothetical protein
VPYDDSSDDDDDTFMDPGVPYLLRVLFDRFWETEDNESTETEKHRASPAAFLFWLIEHFEEFDAKQLCHEAEVTREVYEQLSSMLDVSSGQDIVLTLWPVYTMATHDEPEKSIKAVTVSVGFCYDDNTTAIVQTQTICARSDPDDKMPLTDASVMLALKATLDNITAIVSEKGIDNIHKQNNISLSSAYLAYNLLEKASLLFKEKFAKNLIFLQQFVAGVFAPSQDGKDSAFENMSDYDDDFDPKQEIAEQLDETNGDIDSLFDIE